MELWRNSKSMKGCCLRWMRRLDWPSADGNLNPPCGLGSPCEWKSWSPSHPTRQTRDSYLIALLNGLTFRDIVCNHLSLIGRVTVFSTTFGKFISCIKK